MDIDKYLDRQAELVNKSLDKFLPKTKELPVLIHEAIRYSTLGAGKRIRPVLTIAVNDMLGGSKKDVLIPACAIEMIHSMSLIHDDLPCMDDDDFRRGLPTCHKKYGEAHAVLAGDGLLTEAFYLLSQYPNLRRARKLVEVISLAAGSRGMVGGQVEDKIFEDQEIDKAALDFIHVNKTGKLLAVSCQAGAISAGATAVQEKKILRFGEFIGFAFQIIDDIMDQDGYVKFMSVKEAHDEAVRLTGKAKEELKSFGPRAKTLIAIAEFLVTREK